MILAKNPKTKRAYLAITVVLNSLLLLFAGQLFFPQVTAFILTTLWFLLLIIVVIFISLGSFVLLGMKTEVSNILDMLVEGTLSFFDFVELLKQVIRKFWQELQEFLVFFSPFVAYLIVTVLYFGLLLIYKYFSQTSDVTMITVLLTVLLITFIGIMNLPRKNKVSPVTAKVRILNRFKAGFSDAAEIAVFVFFITLDSTKLFFLPPTLNIPIRADFLGYDLMRSSITSLGAGFTISLIILAVTSEILKNAIRIIIIAVDYYDEAMNGKEPTPKVKTEVIKRAIRRSFGESKDDTLKFIAFTTILLCVFLFFPRLKVLSMAVASLSGLALDFIFPIRLHATRGTDLFSRLIFKVFRL